MAATLGLAAPPTSLFLMGAISAPKTRGRRVVGTSRAPQRLRRTNGEVRRRALGPWRMLPWRVRAKPLGFSRAAVAHFVVCHLVTHITGALVCGPTVYVLS
jgi:hypothetical protein